MTEQSPTIDPIADDRRLDDMFVRLLAALQAADPHFRLLWQEFEDCLNAHMSDEEQRVTPRLASLRLREAHAILQEHRYLRGRLSEMAAAVKRGDLRLENARSLRDELRAHARHEDDIMRRVFGEGDAAS